MANDLDPVVSSQEPHRHLLIHDVILRQQDAIAGLAPLRAQRVPRDIGWLRRCQDLRVGEDTLDTAPSRAAPRA